MQNKIQNSKHNQHHNRRNRQTCNIALTKSMEGFVISQITDRVTVSIHQGSTTENSHGS